MTTAPLGHLKLTIDGEDYQDPTTGLYLWIVRGFNEFADVRGEDTIIPGVNGRVFQDRRSDRLSITVQGYVWGVGATVADARNSFRANMDTVREVFAPNLDPVPWIIEVEYGSQRTLDARGVNMMVNEVVPSLFAEISVECESVTPAWSAV